MAPKKQQAQKMSLGDFLGNQSLGSWADEMEDMPVGSGGTGYGSERRGFGSGGGYGSGSGGGFGGGGDRSAGYAIREELPLPTRPPYTAHVGNMSFDATEGDIGDFFADCQVTNVRIVEDKLERKPKGFGYVEFATLDGLKKALELSGTQFQGRNVRISVADPPKDRLESTKDMSDWTRKGPLPDLPGGGRRVSDRGGGGGYRPFDAGSDAGSDRAERRRPPPFEGDGKVRDFGNWERKGPLSPAAAPAGGMREGGRLRSQEGPHERRQSPAWGEGRSQDGSRPPRREFQERPQYDRQPTAPEMDSQWRTKMRPDPPANAKSPSATPETSTPSSPAPHHAAPATRPRLNLAKRTVSDQVEPALPSASSDSTSKPNPFGAARPIDTAAREKEIEEKRQLAIRQKKEADDKAREEKRAKEAAEKSAAKEKASPAPSQSGSATKETKENGSGEKYEILKRSGEGDGDAAGDDSGNVDASANGEIVEDKAVKPKEVVRAPQKSEGAWRRKGEAPSAPASPAAPAASTTETMQDDGWSTVTKNPKGSRRGGNPTRAIAS